MLGKLIVWSLLGLTTLACLAGCSAMMPTQNSAGTNYSWYVICVDGEAIGWSRTLETKEKKLYRTIIDTEMEIDSSREPAVIKLQHTFVESRDGLQWVGDSPDNDVSNSVTRNELSQWDERSAHAREKQEDRGRAYSRRAPDDHDTLTLKPL